MLERFIKTTVSLMVASVFLIHCETFAEDINPSFELTCQSAVLMEASTGKILYEKEYLLPNDIT